MQLINDSASVFVLSVSGCAPMCDLKGQGALMKEEVTKLQCCGGFIAEFRIRREGKHEKMR